MLGHCPSFVFSSRWKESPELAQGGDPLFPSATQSLHGWLEAKACIAQLQGSECSHFSHA